MSEVTEEGREPNRAAMLSCDPALGAPENWFLAPVPTAAAYCAAVAVRGGSASVSLRLWAWDRPPGRSTGSASTVARTASGPRRGGRAG